MPRQLLLLIAITLTAAATAAQPVLERLENHNRPLAARLVYDNPTLKAERHRDALSSAGAAYNLRRDNNAIDVRQGDRQQQFSLGADTYMKHRTSTLWGDAEYRNITTRNVQWNETSDLDIVEPYLLADPAVRDIKGERYSFGGGYADRRGRLAWGGELHYTAGLYHRNIDPRPKNVTSLLQAKGGVGLSLADSAYLLAAAVEFVKYKQTNEVTFYSEMGNDRLFHLTGLTQDYTRFAGTGYDTYYTGQRWGANIGLVPTLRRGFTADIDFTRLAFDNVLTPLNKLPMARLTRNTLRAEMAWSGQHFDITADITLARTVGTENIFGDAAAGVYPQIGAIDMYHRNDASASLTALWHTRVGNALLHVMPALRYSHRNEVYAQPQSRLLINDLTPEISLQVNRRTAKFYWQINADANVTANLKRQLILPATADALQSLAYAVNNNYHLLSSTHGMAGLSTQMAYALNRRYAIRLTLAYHLHFYTDDTKRHICHAAVAYVF